MEAVGYTHGMSKRLQVIVDDGEYRDLQRTARRHRLTVSEWVRRLIREASRLEPASGPDRGGARGGAPWAPWRKGGVGGRGTSAPLHTADIDLMLRDIERGYLDER